ncbi:MAG: PAS domain-containing protein [Clostridiales bacterium]|nr:PAS domain-containing protein [Clostridiales bacterium]
MNKKIFKSMIAVSSAVLLLCILCISYVLYGYFGDIIKDELRTEAVLISQGIEDDSNYLESMNSIDNRITLVDEDGKVLFDSQADAASMQNHAGRDEISEAAAEGEGSSVRYSDTLDTKTIYFAKLLSDGKIVRVSQDQSVAMLLLKGIIGPVIIIFAVIIILTSMISRMISKKIIKPINEMNLNDPEAEEPYVELAPLITKIRRQNDHIQEQMTDMERGRNEFKAITENMSEGFLLIDKSMEIISHNSAALMLLGNEDMSEPHTALELNRSKGFRMAAEEALSGNHSQQPLETENRQYNIMANPVYEKGEIVGAVIIIVDVTEKEQRDKLRREFTSNVSHELKTPLTTIYGVSDMMAEGLVKAADVKNFGKSIKDESGRMISLIDDIIKLSKLDENPMPEEVSDVDLFETAKDVIDRLNLYAGEKNVNLYLDGEHTLIKGLQPLCSEVVYNLCENAIKYNKEGGSVTVCAKNQVDEAVLTVEDTGIGIPFEYRERIFERFFRVDKSHCSNVTGTGLGLSIVKHAVSQMGGTIEMESSEESGTKMTVRFARVL